MSEDFKALEGRLDIEPIAGGFELVQQKRRSAFVSAAEQQAGFAGVYVIGPRWLPKVAIPDGYSQWPVKFGVTSAPRNALASARQWNHLKVALTALYWTVSKQLATRLKKQLETQLKTQGAHHHGGWFDRDPDMIEMELRFLAERERIELFDETERQDRINGIVAQRAGLGTGRLN